MKKRFDLNWFFYFSIVILITRSAIAADLSESYHSALVNDPTYLAAKEAFAAGREKAVQGRALLKPNLTLSGNYKRQRNEISLGSDLAIPPSFQNLIPTESEGNIYNYSVTLKQQIYRPEAWVGYRQLFAQSGLAEITHQNAIQEVILRVAKVYFDVLKSQDAVRLVTAQKNATKEQRENAQARFDAGRAKITDVREAQARYDAMIASEIAAANDLAISLAEFLEATGLSGENLAEVRSDFMPALPLPAAPEFWLTQGLKNSLLLRSKEQQVSIATAEILKYRLVGQPTLDLFATFNDTRQSAGLSSIVSPEQSQSSVVGFQVEIPLYSGGKIFSHLREAEAKKREAQRDLEAAKRDVRLQVREAFLAVTSGAAQVKALAKALESARTSVEAATIGLEVGVRTTLDVLDVEQRFYSTQRDLDQARYNYLMGRLQLAAATGQLSEDDLQKVNAYLNHAGQSGQ